MRWLNERIAGIDARRRPPAWTSRTFAERFPRECAAPAANRRSAGTSSPGRAVVLFNDTFTDYYTPGVGVAGAKLLQKAGCDPALAPNVCCGRPLISQGLLAEARELAARNADLLAPAAERGAAIVFFEPSCLSAVREDAPSLLRGEVARKATRVAESAVLFEEFLDGIWPADLSVSAGPATVLLHGHCHQKAMGLLAPALRLLARIPAANVVDLDAGCCGMAGSFGYVRENFDVSRAIGERRLLPAARALAADAVLVASGISCRHQVEDFTSVRAVHPAELLHSLTMETA